MRERERERERERVRERKSERKRERITFFCFNEIERRLKNFRIRYKTKRRPSSSD